ncbi:MAG: peptidylprolyl isomerase [Candidatus ainarchaeum sp.]|nr:peptidylprolyl isomerase [Candidatus ainarchaeum sp.]
MPESVAKGDFVKIEFTGTRQSDGSVFDTTDAAKAKEAGVFSEKAKYAPKLVAVGKGMVVPGLDEALEGMAPGEEKSVEAAPEKAYGPRSPSRVRIVPISEFRKQGLSPEPGMMFELDGTPALVRSVTSGRVMVDLNHPLAGETLAFKVKLVEKISGTENRAKALLEDCGLKFESARLAGSSLEVSFPKSGKPDAETFVSKVGFIRAAKELLPEITSFETRETYLLAESGGKKAED